MWPAEGREAEAKGCEHSWTEDSYVRRSNDNKGEETKQSTNAGSLGRDVPIYHAFCTRCEAWRGALGLEPTPDLYVSHLVSVFREVRRVLHPTGVLLCNIGDGYAGGGKAGSNPEYHAKHTMFGKGGHDAGKYGLPQPVPEGLKPTDLVGVPFLLAQALRADGWYLRCVLPWIKPSSAMPESVRSRPSVSHEYFLMLTQRPGGEACWDGEAVRIPHKPGTQERGAQGYARNPSGDASHHGDGFLRNDGQPVRFNEGGRAFRTSDLFLTSLDELIRQQRAYLAHLESCRNGEGLLLDEDGDPLALLVNPKGFSGAQYLGDWSRKEWRVVQEPLTDDDEEEGKPKHRKAEVWYIAAPNCEKHRHYHREDRWNLLGYANGRVPEKTAECGCVECTCDHFATFSPELVLPLLKAACPREVCSKCGAPKVREVETERVGDNLGKRADNPRAGLRGSGMARPPKDTASRQTVGWSATCGCGVPFVSGGILDPFAGSCSTGVAAKQLGRRFVGIDVSADYLVMGARRLEETGLSGKKGKEHAEAQRAGQGTLVLEVPEC